MHRVRCLFMKKALITTFKNTLDQATAHDGKTHLVTFPIIL